MKELHESLSVPASARRMRVNGVELYVVEAGPSEGPLVILLHGFPDFWWGWRHQIESLAKEGFHVVAPDMRGYDQSEKPKGVSPYHIDTLAADVAALADAYNAPTFRLAGHDWGGIVAWWTGVRYSKRVEKLVILNAPHPDVYPRLMVRRWRQALKSFYVAFFQFPVIPDIVVPMKRFAFLYWLFMRRALSPDAPESIFSEEERERYVQVWSKPGELTSTINYYRSLGRRPWQRPARLRPPTLVIWGKRDVFLELEVATAGLRLCDQGEGRFLDAGHWVLLEKAEEVGSEMARFFAVR